MLWRVATPNDLEAAKLVAGGILDAQVRGREGTFSLGLSGGRAAALLFREIVRQARGRTISLADVDFFWCDERCVPPDHPESNYRIAREELFEPMGVADRRIHRLMGELSPDAGAERANDAWRAWVASRSRWGANGSLDCAVLGVGEDGHVASLFPANVSTDLAGRTPFRAVRGPKPPPDRLTMGYELLWEAKVVMVLATGVGKEEVIQNSVSGKLDTPLARVLRAREERETWVVTTAKAA